MARSVAPEIGAARDLLLHPVGSRRRTARSAGRARRGCGEQRRRGQRGDRVLPGRLRARDESLLEPEERELVGRARVVGAQPQGLLEQRADVVLVGEVGGHDRLGRGDLRQRVLQVGELPGGERGAEAPIEVLEDRRGHLLDAGAPRRGSGSTDRARSRRSAIAALPSFRARMARPSPTSSRASSSARIAKAPSSGTTRKSKRNRRGRAVRRGATDPRSVANTRTPLGWWSGRADAGRGRRARRWRGGARAGGAS